MGTAVGQETKRAECSDETAIKSAAADEAEFVVGLVIKQMAKQSKRTTPIGQMRFAHTTSSSSRAFQAPNGR